MGGTMIMVNKSSLVSLILFLLSSPSMAQESMDHDSESTVFHAMRLETDAGRHRGKDTTSWDLDGWIGGDDNKLWVKSLGETVGSKVEQAELWSLYSRNISPFWDAQIGLRQDFNPTDHTYLATGLKGLAPYFFDTEIHVFVRDDGGIGARLRQENELLLTNRLIAKPYAEVNLNAKNDAAANVGTGLTDIQIGLLTRYEFTRFFAPYIDLKYRQKFGSTADYAKRSGEGAEAVTLNFGIRWLF
jgi:copper resistance protein B